MNTQNRKFLVEYVYVRNHEKRTANLFVGEKEKTGQFIASSIDGVFIIEGKKYILKSGQRILPPSNTEQLTPHTESKASSVGRRLITYFQLFRWFVSKRDREHLDLVATDLQRDRNEMLQEGLSAWTIRLSMSLQVLRSIVPILWSSSINILKGIAGVADLIRRIIGKN